MRFIDLNKVVIPRGWEEEARQALEDVSSCANEEKSERINSHANVWQELKGVLSEVSNHKCWYCESIEIRSDNNVDHFRPKNRVFECNGHPGYWWKAFDWHNYRLSCTYCNSHRKDKINKTSGGKQDHFPLCDELHRAFAPGDDIDSEQPTLLDPTTHSDPGLLWFELDGRATPRYARQRYPLQFQRAESSIDLYHLNHEDLKDRRQELSNFMLRRSREGTIYFMRYANGDQTAFLALESVFLDLTSAVSEEAVYSSAARATLFSLSKKEGYEWIESVL
jgi:uncharacterized protein (TIGR02646 family)